MTCLIAYHDGDKTDERQHGWQMRLTAYLPGCQLVPLADNAADDAEIALVWGPPDGRLAELSQLKLAVSLGQGVDHLMVPGKLPDDIPLIRIVDPDMSHALSQWVILAALDHLRDGPMYREQARQRIFSSHSQRQTRGLPLAVYGMGAIGSMIATRLADIGFQVHGWSRSERPQAGVITMHHGHAGFDKLLSTCQLHVCILPLTDETWHIFGADAFAAMPRGAYFINGGRGAQVDEAALLQAIVSGHIAGATLDVFEHEPLPDNHPFWDESRITIWPHVAAQTNPETAAQQVADAIMAMQAGHVPANLVDRQRGY
ncbi:MAG: Glyoxylate/hydroxypyruvate reductase A [Alphaproteobacteria bacterium UBA4588]|nr:MAG: Glyoxylate/hydroxypyruvate reductase A [Alphaproteobacteria bacterium UBA4588]